MASGGLFRKFRILIMLFILFIVATDAYLTKIRSTDWDRPLVMVVYPINADGSDVSNDYIQQLSLDTFNSIEHFLQEEAKAFELNLAKPIEIRLAPPLKELPPKPPAEKSPLKTMWWSLKMRYWSLTVKNHYQGPPANIKMYVLYFNPEDNERLDHSLGLEKGLIGVVNAYADEKYAGKNNIVLVHEFLHTVGATDKYNSANGKPLYPVGFVEPDKDPLYPQEFAEIMAGVIPMGEMEWVMPETLDQTVLGYQTAQEINWIQTEE